MSEKSELGPRSSFSWDVGYTTTPGMYDLSQDLSQDLAEWNALWDANFDPSDGWQGEAAREKWRKDGVEIAARLRAEVADFADVKYEPWPLGSRSQ